MTFRPRHLHFAFASFFAGCTSAENAAAPTPCPGNVGSAGEPMSGADALEEIASFGDNPGGLKMYVHAPADKTPRAVVLALHGCTQNASDYLSAGWNDLADREGLVVVYGEQSSVNNPLLCFRWWDPAHNGRSGEAQSLANMVTAAHAKYGTKRAFVTGLSAGGAMTSVMLAAYPELFEAGAIMAGVPYKCATSAADVQACTSGREQSADAWGALVPKLDAGVKAPRVSIWQGEADSIVRSANREELVKQWTKVNGVSETPDDTITEGPATHSVHRDSSGVVRVESWAIARMGHGVAIDPKSGCGATGDYALDVGVCSASAAADFFLGERTSAAGGDDAGAGADPCR